jgi:seryl-tRNA synthetase
VPGHPRENLAVSEKLISLEVEVLQLFDDPYQLRQVCPHLLGIQSQQKT